MADYPEPPDMAHFFRVTLAVLATALVLPALAQEDKVRAALKKSLPDAPIDSVKKTPYGGLYEVTMGSDIYYVDEKATFVVMGSLVDLNTKQNVTELRQRELLKVDFAALPLDHAFKIVRGNGSRKIAMFADPNCGYCKRFERDLIGVNDITVYMFLYPILSPDSIDKARKIWCSADPGKAWLDWMVRDVPIQGEAKCNTAVIEQNVAFGHDKKVTGTPTMFFEDGDRIPGAIAIADFEKKLAATKAGKPAKTASAQ
jgi:thiol:disulfide interchange protein DsbC